MKPAVPLFALFLKLDAQPCLVVGAGSLAESKLASLLASGARVTVVAPEATPRIRALAARGKIVWHARRFRAADANGARLAVAATSSPAVNHAVFAACTRRRVLCNIVDDPDYCDFYYPAVARRGPLQIAVSTGGASPALARRLRQQLERAFPADYAAWLAHLGKERERILRSALSAAKRRAALERLSSAVAFRAFVRAARRPEPPRRRPPAG
jgi:precorrin-2 dehydrogenase/sirohydrochlorin ferrochelatase